MEKRYLAVLDGVPEGGEGVVDLPLLKVSTAETGWRMVGDPAGKAARTGWRVLEVKDGRSFVEFLPQTGRTHQIRVHAAEALGAPVVGDPIYGSGGPHTLLHAAELTVPREGKDPIVAVAPLPDDPVVHRALLAYVSDHGLLSAAMLPHGLSFTQSTLRMASLDHAMWFHRDFRLDDWLLYVTDSPNAGGARALSRGSIFARDGRLVASTAQEGMLRVRR